jgi:hypothetical protein
LGFVSSGFRSTSRGDNAFNFILLVEQTKKGQEGEILACGR